MPLASAITLLHSASSLRMVKCANESEAKAFLIAKLNELSAEFKSELLSLLRFGSIEKASAAELVSASSTLHSMLTKDPVIGLLELALFGNVGTSNSMFCFYLNKIPDPLKSRLIASCTEYTTSDQFIVELNKVAKK